MDLLKYLAIEFITHYIGQYLEQDIKVADIEIDGSDIIVKRVFLQVLKFPAFGPLRFKKFVLENISFNISYVQNFESMKEFLFKIKKIYVQASTQNMPDRSCSDISIYNIEDYHPPNLDQMLGKNEVIIERISQFIEKLLFKMSIVIDRCAIDICDHEQARSIYLNIARINTTQQPHTTQKTLNIGSCDIYYKSSSLDTQFETPVVEDSKLMVHKIATIESLATTCILDKKPLNITDLSESSYINFKEYNLKICIDSSVKLIEYSIDNTIIDFATKLINKISPTRVTNSASESNLELLMTSIIEEYKMLIKVRISEMRGQFIAVVSNLADLELIINRKKFQSIVKSAEVFLNVTPPEIPTLMVNEGDDAIAIQSIIQEYEKSIIENRIVVAGNMITAEDYMNKIYQSLLPRDIKIKINTGTLHLNHDTDGSLILISKNIYIEKKRQLNNSIILLTSQLHGQQVDTFGTNITDDYTITVQNIEVLDQVKESKWNKLLCTDIVKNFANDQTIAIRATVRDNKLNLSVKLAPLRIFATQYTLLFLHKVVGPYLEFNPNTPSPIFDVLYKIDYQRIHIYPMQVRVDYKPINFNLQNVAGGSYAELINLVQIQDLTINMSGYLKVKPQSFSIVLSDIKKLWLGDITGKVPYRYFSSIMIINSLITMGSGITDLVMVPYNQYMSGDDDAAWSSIFRGFGMGLMSMLEKLTKGSMDILSRITIGTNTLLENGQAMMNPDVVIDPRSKFAQQPKNIGEGLSDAYTTIVKEFSEAGNIILMPYRRSEALMTALPKTIPIMLLRPISGTLFGISKIMLGIKNTMNDDYKREMDDKYGTD